MEHRESSPNTDPLEDSFLINLIDVVQKNPCVYNRYDPLHKVADYKHEIWKMIARETRFDGQPVELERKWRHMRDKYVRLRKIDRQNAPIKKCNKWYNYYMKMSFLDPYVEHRNRRKREEEEEFEETRGNTSDNDIIIDEIDESFETADALNKLYESLLTPETFLLDSEFKEPSPSPDQPRTSSIREISISMSPPPPLSPPPNLNRKRKRVDVNPTEEVDIDDESEVSLFVRSIAKNLSSMDRRTFAIARIEIAKVLYTCQFGELQADE